MVASFLSIKMKFKLYILIICVLALAACSSSDSDIVNPDQPDEPSATAIVFTGPQALAMTRATTPLADLGYYNFGIFTFKENSSANVQTMNNFIVGYDDGSHSHYNSGNASTWGSTSERGKSPWFYEGLNNQPIVYWDKAYTMNSFYYYTPYMKGDSVIFDRSSESFTVGHGVLHDGYDSTLADYTAYKDVNPSKSEFLFGTTAISSSDYGDNVQLPFHHFYAQVQMGFYAATEKYYIEIADLDADNGNIKSGTTEYNRKGIQATPAGCVMSNTGSVSAVAATPVSYVSAYDRATFKADGTEAPSSDGATESTDNLVFRIPDSISGNLTKHSHDNIVHYCIPEAAVSGSSQTYAYSPTTYYAMPQSQNFVANGTAGFTLHLTLRLIPKSSADSLDHKETTVHNVRFYIPPYVLNGSAQEPVTMWRSGYRYIYHFRITDNVSGTTDPSAVIDPQGTQPSTGIELVDFDVYVPDPRSHGYRRTTIRTIPTGDEDPDQPADAKRHERF